MAATKQRTKSASSAASAAEPSRGLGGLESGMWVRLSAEVVERVKAEARAEDRKPSNMARVLIGEALAQREAKARAEAYRLHSHHADGGGGPRG